MGDTTSNHNRLIVNKGSDACAKHIVPDFCFKPNWVPDAYDNVAPLSRLGAGKTTRTTIKGSEICVLGTKIGPKSEAAHTGINKGVISHDYQGWAMAITFSLDVFAEKLPVVRLDDYTIQNSGNTIGKIIAGQHKARKDSHADYAKKKCNLQKLEGVCGHGRKLGWLDPDKWGKGEAKYLEILLDDTVDLKVERYDITEDPNVKSPACEKNHTAWTAEVTRFPTKSKKTHTHNGDDWTIEANWALSPTAKVFEMLTGGSPTESDTESAERAGQDVSAERSRDLAPKDRSYSAANEARDRANMKNFNLGTPAQQEQAIQDNKARAREAQDKENRTKRSLSMNVDITDMFKLFAWVAMPPTIDVKAIACSAAKTVTIKVYPQKKYKFVFTLTREVKTKSPIAKIRAGILAVKNAANIVKKVVALAGQRFEFAFLEGFVFEWEIQYKEHTKFEGFMSRTYTPATVGQDWSLKLASDPLLRVETKVIISLLDFLGPAGKVAASVLRRVGTRIDFEFGAKIELAIACNFGWDEYKKLKSPQAEFEMKLTLWGAIVAGVVGVEIRGTVEFITAGSVLFRTSEKPGCLMQWNYKWSFKTHITVTAKAWRWISWKAYDGWPRGWRYVQKESDQWGDLFTTAN